MCFDCCEPLSNCVCGGGETYSDSIAAMVTAMWGPIATAPALCPREFDWCDCDRCLAMDQNLFWRRVCGGLDYLRAHPEECAAHGMTVASVQHWTEVMKRQYDTLARHPVLRIPVV